MADKKVGLRGILILALATVSEGVGLIVWLRMVDSQTEALGIIALIVSQLIERIAVVLIAQDAYAGRPFPPNFYQLVTISASVESGIWIVWLMVWDSGFLAGLWQPLVTTTALFVMQLFFHSWVMSFALNKPPFFRYAKDPLTIVFSAIEALAGWLWLITARSDRPVLAVVIIFVGLTVEHVIQGIAIDSAGPPDFVGETAEA